MAAKRLEQVGWAKKPGGILKWRGPRLSPEKLAALGLVNPDAPTPPAIREGVPPDHVVTGALEQALAKAMADAARTGEPYLTIDDLCRKYDISRSSFYEMLPRLTAEGLAVRVPPGGPLRVPVGRFGAWLHAQAQPAAVKRARRKGGS